MIVVFVFAVCWLPLNLYHFLTDIHPDSKMFHYNSTAFFVCHWIALSSTCYNPFIYCWLNEAFRAEIRAIFRCCCPADTNIYPRDNKMDSVSQSDSMSLQIKPKSLFTSKRNNTMTEHISAPTMSPLLPETHSCIAKHGCEQCKCRSEYVTSSMWRSVTTATESVDLLEHERNRESCSSVKSYNK